MAINKNAKRSRTQSHDLWMFFVRRTHGGDLSISKKESF